MKYTQSHEWIEMEGNIGKVGITQHAQKELGDIVYVELPKVGKTIKAGQGAAVLESTKAAADVYTPVSGTIVEVNTTLKDKPELINQSPENEGWLFKIALDNNMELEGLVDAASYELLIT